MGIPDHDLPFFDLLFGMLPAVDKFMHPILIPRIQPHEKSEERIVKIDAVLEIGRIPHPVSRLLHILLCSHQGNGDVVGPEGKGDQEDAEQTGGQLFPEGTDGDEREQPVPGEYGHENGRGKHGHNDPDQSHGIAPPFPPYQAVCNKIDDERQVSHQHDHQPVLSILRLSGERIRDPEQAPGNDQKGQRDPEDHFGGPGIMKQIAASVDVPGIARIGHLVDHP